MIESSGPTNLIWGIELQKPPLFSVKKEWHQEKVGLGLNKEIFDAEIWGIFKALQIAKKKAQEIQETQNIYIFSDSQTIINNSRSYKSIFDQVRKI